MTAGEVDWILFDLNGTLLDPRAIARAWSDDPTAGDVAVEVLDSAVVQAMADTVVGEFRPFPEYLAAALALRVPDDAVDDAVEAASAMPAVPGALEAVAQLAATMRVGVLTNSATDSAEKALDQAGLSACVSLVAGADEVRRYKPHPAVYDHGVELTGAPRNRVLLAAAHWWDVHGAKAAGLRTCWIAPKEERLLASAARPDIRVTALDEIPAALSRP